MFSLVDRDYFKEIPLSTFSCSVLINTVHRLTLDIWPINIRLCFVTRQMMSYDHLLTRYKPLCPLL